VVRVAFRVSAVEAEKEIAWKLAVTPRKDLQERHSQCDRLRTANAPAEQQFVTFAKTVGYSHG